MSKSIFEAAKRTKQVLFEMYDVVTPTTMVRVWPGTEAYCVLTYGERPDNTFMLSQIFDDDFSTTEFSFSTLSELQQHVSRYAEITK